MPVQIPAIPNGLSGEPLINAINDRLRRISLAPGAGVSATIATAKLTGGGKAGSMTFVNGVLTAQTQAT